MLSFGPNNATGVWPVKKASPQGLNHVRADMVERTAGMLTAAAGEAVKTLRLPTRNAGGPAQRHETGGGVPAKAPSLDAGPASRRSANPLPAPYAEVSYPALTHRVIATARCVSASA
jgi:hypothetical protein